MICFSDMRIPAERLVPAFSDDELAQLDAAVSKVLKRGFDRWTASEPKEELTLEVLSRLTVDVAIKEKGLLGAFNFLQSRIYEMLMATAIVEIEGRRASTGAGGTVLSSDGSTHAGRD